MRYLPHYHGPMPTDIPETFGYRSPYWCATCGPIQEIETPRREDLETCCAGCGSTDIREHDDPKPFRAIRRGKTIHMEIAA